MLAAHCCLGGSERYAGIPVPREHGPGPCRLNRAMAKGPIGMLVRWLQVQQQYLDRDAHFKACSKTKQGGELDYDHRREARSWLQECGAADIEYLFELEAEARGGGDSGEPLRIN